jgi:coniferyl-aldehyde dehydrogenase
MDLSDASLAALHSDFSKLKRGFEADRMPSRESRRSRLAALDAMLRENADALATAISADFSHRSRHETQMLELFPALSAIKHARSHVGPWAWWASSCRGITPCYLRSVRSLLRWWRAIVRSLR